ncbi:hypothetical protein MMC12_002721 [Toensbergia leucococca]|nr:hypothetical protein [Toensbergia leucococca]
MFIYRIIHPGCQHPSTYQIETHHPSNNNNISFKPLLDTPAEPVTFLPDIPDEKHAFCRFCYDDQIRDIRRFYYTAELDLVDQALREGWTREKMRFEQDLLVRDRLCAVGEFKKAYVKGGVVGGMMRAGSCD